MEKTLLLRQVPLFSLLSIAELRRYSKSIELLPFIKDQVICEEGMPSCQSLYVVVSGTVNVLLGGKVLTTLSSPNYFGEVSLLSGGLHSATIKAETSGQLLLINRKLFNEIVKQHPEVLLWLSRALGDKLHQTAKFSSQQKEQAKAIAVLPAEECVGVSFLTVNFAASYMKQVHNKVVVLDLCYQANSAAGQLGLDPNLTLSRLVRKDKRVTAADINRCLVQHASGVDVLVFCRQGELFQLDQAVIASIFRILKKIYACVLVDAPFNLSLAQKIAIAQEVEKVLILTRENKKALLAADNLFKRLKIEKEKSLLVVRLKNQQKPKKLLSGDCLVLPHEPLLRNKITGKPFVLEQKSSSLALCIGRIARTIANLRIGLALSSGMASGLAHIGVLKVLQRENIPIDHMAGTSGGALFSSPFASGVALTEIQTALNKINRLKMILMLDFTFPFAGFIRGEKIINFIKSFIGNRRFEELFVDFKVIATDFNSGEVFVIDKGPIVPALRASIAVPGIFSPCKFNGRFLVDGATVSPLPVDVLYHAGASKVMAVNTCTDPLKHHKKSGSDKALSKFMPHFFDIISHSRAITSHHMAKSESQKADVIINPDTSPFSWRDYHKAAKIIEAGEKAAEEALPSIREMLRVKE